jgi:hypothetical protein
MIAKKIEMLFDDMCFGGRGAEGIGQLGCKE